MGQTSKIFLFGLDNSGKTSIVNSIKKLPNPGETSPTINFSISQIIIDNTEFVIWDAPGQINYRKNWGQGLGETRILCFVVDILDPDRFDDAKKELEKILNDAETRNLPLIICFHKLDIPDAKKNLPTARGKFSPTHFDDREIHTLETTIFNPDSILKLKSLFVDLIEKTRW